MKTKLAAGVVLALVAVGAVVTELKNPVTGDAYEVRAEPVEDKGRRAVSGLSVEERKASKLGALPDGGAVAVLLLSDGGADVLDALPCVRRPAGRTDCRRLDPTGKVTDMGDWGRFLATEAQGTECEPCACSVFLGDKAEP